MIDFNGRVHWGIALFIWLLICVPNNLWLNPIPFLIGSIFPDSDIKYSKIGKILPLWLIWNHRGWVHSLPALVVFSLPIGVFYSWNWCALFASGYLLHLAMDSSTPMGVKWITGHKKRTHYR